MSYRPENLKYIARQATELQIHHIDSEARLRPWSVKPKRTIQVRPTFIADALKEKAIERGVAWASQQVWDITAQKYLTGVCEVFDKPNSPIAQVELLDISRRGGGGRAWKVLIEGTFYVDLREDQLLSALRDGKGCKKGMLLGPFVWEVHGSQIRLTHDLESK